jgi:hypothetical protein
MVRHVVSVHIWFGKKNVRKMKRGDASAARKDNINTNPKVMQ